MTLRRSARRALRASIFAVTVAAAAMSEVRGADDAAPASQRSLLGRSEERAVQRPCELSNCATVEAVYHRDPWEPSPPITAHGLSRNPPFSNNVRGPVYTQPSSTVQRRRDVWVIEVRKRDGSLQVIEQDYPALFQAGDRVLVEGDRVRAPD